MPKDLLIDAKRKDVRAYHDWLRISASGPQHLRAAAAADVKRAERLVEALGGELPDPYESGRPWSFSSSRRRSR